MNILPHSRGFTLIELLTVIAIVGLLVAIAVPVVGKLRQHANQTTATNNLRALVVAQIQYATENNGEYTGGWAKDKITWQAQLLPYTYGLPALDKELTALKARGRTMYDVPEADQKRVTGNSAKSIALNWSLPGGTSTAGWRHRVRAVPRPSSIILLGEMVEANSDTMTPPDVGRGPGAPSTPAFRRAGNTKALMAFCDGHVAALDEAALNTSDKTKETNLWRWW